MSWLNALFPVECLICGRRFLPHASAEGAGDLWHGSRVCLPCRDRVELLAGSNRCDRCSAPLPVHLSRCERCRRTEYHFARHLSVCEYGGRAGALVRSYKFRGHRSLSHVLARLMADSAPGSWRTGHAVVPVPSARRSIRRRGFDAVGDVALHMSRLLGLPFRPALAHRGTRVQKALTYEERMANVAGAFVLRTAGRRLGGKVLLVDDVFTTGATTSECAAVLLGAGASAVVCLTFAMDL